MARVMLVSFLRTRGWEYSVKLSFFLTLTCDSVIPSAKASLALSGPARYLVFSNVFSRAKICCPENVGRVCFLALEESRAATDETAAAASTTEEGAVEDEEEEGALRHDMSEM